jgi:hypothetical protein
MKFLEKIDETLLARRPVKSEAVYKKRDTVLLHEHHHQLNTHDQDTSIEEDLHRGYYCVISFHVPERPSELNLALDDVLRVETIFSDGCCYA